MKMNKKEIKKLEKLIDEKAKVGMELTLGDKILTCINTMDSSYGIRYVFDNGLGFTKSNILSNIINYVSQDLNWDLR